MIDTFSNGPAPTFADVASAMLEAATALGEHRSRLDTPEDRFVAAIARHGTVIAHPDTIAALDSGAPEWREVLGVREAIPCAWMSRGPMYAGRFTPPTGAEWHPVIPAMTRRGT